jgi:hypothetical protein
MAEGGKDMSSVFEDVVGDYLAALGAIEKSPYVLKEAEERRLRDEALKEFDAKYESAIVAACTAKVEPIERAIADVEDSARSPMTMENEMRTQRLCRMASEAGDQKTIDAVVAEANAFGAEDAIRSVMSAALDRHRVLTSGKATTVAAGEARQRFELQVMAWREQHPTTSERLAMLRRDRQAAIDAAVREAQHVRQMALARARQRVVPELSARQD